MKRLTELAFGKLNLSLDVLETLPDGYHAMEMIMQSVDLCDTVRLQLRPDDQITVSTDRHFLPCDARNLAWRAARLFLDTVGSAAGVDIRLTKRIPVGAGMAGGSADAAAVLRGMNTLLEAGLSWERLEELGLALGADVPYCVRGGTMLAQGKGEKLSPLPPMPKCHILICKPRFSISTPSLFSRLDEQGAAGHPDTPAVIRALERKDLDALGGAMYNVFTTVLPEKYAGTVQEIRRVMLEHGALGAEMTGTGSAVFGLFRRRHEGERARKQLQKSYRECYLCCPLPGLSR